MAKDCACAHPDARYAFMFVYKICMYVCVHPYIHYTQTHAYILRTHIPICIHALPALTQRSCHHVCVHTHNTCIYHTHTHKRMHTHIHTCTHTCKHTYMRAYIHACIHGLHRDMYIHNTHTHTHACIHTSIHYIHACMRACIQGPHQLLRDAPRRLQQAPPAAPPTARSRGLLVFRESLQQARPSLWRSRARTHTGGGGRTVRVRCACARGRERARAHRTPKSPAPPGV